MKICMQSVSPNSNVSQGTAPQKIPKNVHIKDTTKNCRSFDCMYSSYIASAARISLIYSVNEH